MMWKPKATGYSFLSGFKQVEYVTLPEEKVAIDKTGLELSIYASIADYDAIVRAVDTELSPKGFFKMPLREDGKETLFIKGAPSPMYLPPGGVGPTFEQEMVLISDDLRGHDGMAARALGAGYHPNQGWVTIGVMAKPPPTLLQKIMQSIGL